MKTKTAMLMALSLCGCATKGPDHVYTGTPETGFTEVPQTTTAQRVGQVLDATLQGVGDFSRGYAEGAQQYQPTQPYGTVTATSITPGQLPTTTYPLLIGAHTCSF